MGWKQLARTIAAEQRRAERESMRRYRELARQEARSEQLAQKQAEKEAARAEAERQVRLFENYLEVLVSLHKDCGEALDLEANAASQPPVPPTRTNQREAGARAKLAAYQPGFFAKLFGAEKRQRAALEQSVAQAVQADQAEYDQAQQAHAAEMLRWRARVELARRLLAGDATAYGEALDRLNAFEELRLFQTRVTVLGAEPGVISLACNLEDPELVPEEEVKLTASGKLSSKAMAASKYWALYQDHVCSCALRAAREAFAALPVSRVIVNVGLSRLDSSSGHMRAMTLLSVQYTRDGIAKLNMQAIDPSDSLKHFPHRMKFKKTSGFDEVEPITADEQWVTA